MREIRIQRGLSYRELAKWTLSSKSHLCQFEHGQKIPSFATARRIDDALEAGGELAAMVTDGNGARVSDGLEFAATWTRAVDVATGLWRDDLHQPATPAVFSPLAYAVPAMRWLTATFDERPERAGRTPVEEPQIDTIRRMTATFRSLDNLYGGGHVRTTVVRFLASDVAPLLRDGRFDAAAGAPLLSATAELTRLAGWAAYDTGMHGLAQRYLIQALRLAMAAADRPLGAEILAAMSHQSTYLRAHGVAVDLARAADRVARDAGVQAIQAEAAVMEAHGHAVAGNEAACAKALDRAERTLDAADRSKDPQWIRYFDEAYLSAKFGHCFTAMGRGDLAGRFAARSLDMDAGYVRGRQFNLALLAVAHAQAGDPEPAGMIGLQAVELAERLQSTRAVDYLRDLAGRLAAHVGVAEVDEFQERVRPLLAAA